MDQLTTDLLVRWGLCEYVDKFRDGRVDSGTLRLLADDEISQLISIPGDRARFKANLHNWKEELSSLNVEKEDLIFSNSSLGNLIRDVAEAVDENLTYRSLQTTRTSTPILSSREFLSNSREDCLLSTPTTSRLFSNTALEDSPPKSNSPINTCQPESLVQGYVLKTLSSTLDGKAIVSQRANGKLNESQRNLLVKLLITPLFESDPNCHISNKQLLSWSLEIQQLFEKESSALYYMPYVAPLVHTTARNASGKLLRYVYNKRRQLRERGIIKASTRSRSSSRSSTSTVSVSPLISLSGARAEADDEIREKLNWLRNSLEPWHLVQENWTLTANYRLNHNYLASGTIQEYFDEYPVLKRPAGYHLLLEDFKTLYEGKSDVFFNNIVSLREKIIQLAKNKANNTRDKDIKQSIENYLIKIAENDNPEVANNGALLLLPYITSSVPLKQKKKEVWRPSKSEVRDGFISQIGSDAEFESTISARREKLQKYGKTLQPFVVFIGESIASVSHCFVVAGDTYYKLNTLSFAVDTCFKIIHATGANYQDESFVIWMIIQKAFYNIVTPYDKELTTVKSLLIDLGL